MDNAKNKTMMGKEINSVEKRIDDFSEWLTSEFSLPEKIVKEYIDALRNCSKYSVQYEIINKSLFEVNDQSIVSMCKSELFVKPVFRKMNEKANNLYGKALDKYYLFIKGKS